MRWGKGKRKDHGNGQGKGKNGRDGGRKDGFKYLINIVSDNTPLSLGQCSRVSGGEQPEI